MIHLARTLHSNQSCGNIDQECYDSVLSFVQRIQPREDDYVQTSDVLNGLEIHEIDEAVDGSAEPLLHGEHIY